MKQPDIEVALHIYYEKTENGMGRLDAVQRRNVQRGRLLHWEIVPDIAPVTAWADIADGSVITEGTVVSQDGKMWVCISQHFKSTVYKPKAGSSKWEEKVYEKEVRKLS